MQGEALITGGSEFFSLCNKRKFLIKGVSDNLLKCQKCKNNKRGRYNKLVEIGSFIKNIALSIRQLILQIII